MSAKTVFISYSHDSTQHGEKVRGLSSSLSRDGCECRVDVYKDNDEDWPTWMTRQLIEANFVLCVISETYERRFRDKELPDVGRGVGWEAGLIRRLLYQKKLHNDRVFPVLFDRADEQYIPLELQGFDFFVLDGQAGYETLLRKVLNRPLYTAPEIGTPPDLDTTTTRPLFERPTGQAEGTRAGRESARYDISRIIKYAPAELIGRENQLKILSDAWDKAVRKEKGRAHILTFVALGGEGKTSLVAKWAGELAHIDWPGCEAAFAWSFYSQGTSDKTQASSDSFLKEALLFFGDAEMANSPAGSFAKGRRLAQLIGEGRALLILDGVEPLQYAPTSPTGSELKDQGVSALLKALATNNDGLCVVTTRYSIPDLRNFWQSTASEIKLTSLSRDAGVALLRKVGVKGTQKEFEQLVNDVKGHALTLNLLGSYLRDAHAGDIRKRDLVKLEEADAEEQSGHAFHVMDAYVESFKREGEKGTRALAILRLLGLFDRPATFDCLNALWTGDEIGGLSGPIIGISEAQRNITLKRLEDAHLITVNRDSGSQQLASLDAHPLLREYFAKRVREELPGGWRTAHRRLYEYLRDNTNEGDEPTLEDLQPLYEAVAHGCQAGMQLEACEEVFIAKIRRGNEGYSYRKLGAFGSDLGAIAFFFDSPWSRVSPAITEFWNGWLLNAAAFTLRALGRLNESLHPLRLTLETNVAKSELKNAAACALNLSELEVTLGEVAAAVRDGRQSVSYADRSGDEFMQLTTRSTLGDALQQAGNRVEAEAAFSAAEQLQAQAQPSYPLLYSTVGFRYCDLLLSDAERASWKFCLESQFQSVKPATSDSSVGLETKASASPLAKLGSLNNLCRTVSERAAKMFEWRLTGDALLDIALDHLTIFRTSLYVAILNESESRDYQSEIESAVTGLRHAGTMHWIPTGLLTRAWLRSLMGKHIGPESAQSDLDEAWEIAERGPMRLHMADIHLYRARLFGGMKDEGGGMKYPWDKNPDGSPRGPKDDLAAARKLIEQCGYWRRKEELEDAEAAAKNW
jgi:tetratricopeptide (TPR) repeat protein